MTTATKVTHTPGPWKVGFGGNMVTTEPDGAGRANGIASLVGINRNDDELKAANANVIAAAPDLLEALEDLLAKLPRNLLHPIGYTDAPLDVAIDNARAAIAKAKGSAA